MHIKVLAEQHGQGSWPFPQVFEGKEKNPPRTARAASALTPAAPITNRDWAQHMIILRSIAYLSSHSNIGAPIGAPL